MRGKFLLPFLFLAISVSLFAQENDKSKHRLNIGVNLNIPSKPTNVNYGVGFGISEQYEYLLWEHWSIAQGLGFKNLNGKDVTEFYENKNIVVDYEYFRTVSFQLGVGFYFGEGQSTFFILFKGGIAQFWSVTPAYPAVIVNNIEIKKAIPREEVNGNFWFFDPKIGWQFNRIQISADFHGTVNRDSQINVWSLGFAFNLIKP